MALNDPLRCLSDHFEEHFCIMKVIIKGVEMEERKFQSLITFILVFFLIHSIKNIFLNTIL